MVRNDEGRVALLSLAFGFTGVLKLLGLEARMFRRWGLSPRTMRGVGVLEAAGAIMVARPQTRPAAAAGLCALSAIMLAVEVRNRETELVLPRLGLLAIAAQTFLGSRRA